MFSRGVRRERREIKTLFSATALRYIFISLTSLRSLRTQREKSGVFMTLRQDQCLDE